jgi:hypothetical protein
MVVAINLTAIILSSLALLISLAALASVIGQKISTHRIEWRPLTTEAIKDEVLEEQDNVEEQDAEILSKAYTMQRSSKKSKPDQDPLDDILKSHNF